ncbi:MAG: hypothetical protein JWQ79_85 [Mucilaginibacter sp.]|nr:hypothetical protein [Mucilaginibacter sp.]
MKKLIPYIIVVLLLAACIHRKTNVGKKDSLATKIAVQPIIKKDSIIKKTYPLTDSGQLMRHLDSLPKFSFDSELGVPTLADAISLSQFKNKKLFNIPLKLIPTVIGGGGIDHADDLDNNNNLPDSIKETFDLVDTSNHNKTTAIVIAITPKFVVLDLNGILLTLNYKVEVIDAINMKISTGNPHWHSWRETTIHKDLSLVLHHYYEVQTDEQGHFDREHKLENWFIDTDGHIKKQFGRHSKKKYNRSYYSS